MKLRLWQVDAFSEHAFGGNPAAIVPLAAWIDDGLMQKIANENNLAETAFFVRHEAGKYALRWFTPEAEVDLCGHATLASAWLIFETLAPELKSVAFETRSGTLTVERGRDGRHVMSLPSDQIRPFAQDGVAAAIGEALGVAPRKNFSKGAIWLRCGTIRQSCAALKDRAILRGFCDPSDCGD